MKLDTQKRGIIFTLLMLIICVIQVLIISVYSINSDKRQILLSKSDKKMAYEENIMYVEDSWGVHWELVINQDNEVILMKIDTQDNDSVINYVYLPYGKYYNTPSENVVFLWGDYSKVLIPSDITIKNLYIDSDISMGDITINGTVNNMHNYADYSDTYNFTGHTHSESIIQDLPYYNISYINIEEEYDCTQASIKKYDCTICGNEYNSILEEAHSEHNYKWINIDETCEQRGYRVGICTRCTSQVTEYTTDIPSGHNYEFQEKINPTCTTQGYDRYQCTKCKRNENINYTDSLGHNYASQITTSATCTTDGVKTYTCSNCNSSYTEQISATGHNYTSQITTPATCTTNGVRTYTCSNCNNSYTEQIVATGHNYTSQITTPATWVTSGVRTYTCSNCSNSYEEIIAALTATNIGTNVEAVIDIDTVDVYIYSSNNQIGTINKELFNAFLENYGRTNVKTITFKNEVIAPNDSSNLFSGLTSLTNINNANNINISNVTSIAGIFLNCSNLEEINISNWNTSKVTNMNKTFSNCSKLEKIDLSKWDMNLVNDASEMFIECSALSEIFTPKTYSAQNVSLPNGTWYNIGNTNDNNSYTNYNNTFTGSVHLAKLVDYNITYNLNGGTVSGNPSTYNFVSSFTIKNPTKEGYTFAGWTCSNGDALQKNVFILPRTLTGNLTYTANWESNEEYNITSGKYNINLEQKNITKVGSNTSVSTFINNITTNGSKKIVNTKGQEVAKSALVVTGYKLQVEYKAVTYEYEIAVRGDLDGNGKITITDLSIINQIFVGKLKVNEIRKKAADLDYNGNVTITDISMINQAIVQGKQL